MMIASTSAEVLARFGHALSDPTRARLLLVLRSGSAYPSELAEILGVGRTNLSNHLACLRGCGLVVATAEGRRQRYELAHDKLRHALGDLLDVVLAVDADHVHPADAPPGDVHPAGVHPGAVPFGELLVEGAPGPGLAGVAGGGS